MTQPDRQTLFRMARLIPFALLGGATTFLGVVLVLAFTGANPGGSTQNPWIWIVISLGSWAMGQAISGVILASRQAALLGDAPEQAYFQLVIIRTALHEGPALMGLVGLLVCLPADPLSAPPECGLLLVPYLSLAAVVLFKRPSEDDFNDRLRVAKENQSMRKG